jgi:MFS family permease
VSTESVAASYRGLFAEPVLRRLAVADVCARLPQGMVSITLLLVAAQHASMAVSGLVVAGYALGQAVTGPVRGRLADRRGRAGHRQAGPAPGARSRGRGRGRAGPCSGRARCAGC